MSKQKNNFFFAAPIPSPLISELETVQKPFTAAIKKVRPSEKLHLTLAWLGPQTINKRVLQDLTRPLLQPYVIAVRLTHIGLGLPGEQLWTYAQPSNALTGLHTQLTERISESGLEIPRDARHREFVPHITLAILKPRTGILADQPISSSFTISEVVLYESKQGSEEAVYVKRGMVPLAATETVAR